MENIIERAVIVSNGNKLILGDWFSKSDTNFIESELLTLNDLEKKHILKVLEMTNWRVSGKKGASSILGINSHTLGSRMKKLGISRKL